MTRIRQKRDKPGLRPQHVKAIQACRSFSGGRLDGAEVNSQEIFYAPGPSLRGGSFRWDIGTAGSTTMLAYTLIPLALFAQAPSRFSIHGGLFQDFAPSFFHMQRVLVPVLQKMGARINLRMVRPGYVPRGGGHIEMAIFPLDDSLLPLSATEPGKVRRIEGVALASHLGKERVAYRMANHCRALLKEKGYEAAIEILEDQTSVQKGAAFFLSAQTDKGCFLGADQAGKLGRRSEDIAGFVVAALIEDLAAKATTDRHLADQLILFAALARGKTRYAIPRLTDHIESNLWLVEKILGAIPSREGNFLQVEGIGFHRELI
jgi:RNA 3'-terminal phosphate cyclase (ATP)